MAVTGLQDRASMVQRDLQEAVLSMRPVKAKTLRTFEQGTRTKQAQLAGLQIAYWKDRANGQSWYSPIAGDTSFKKSTKQRSGAMYGGVVFRNMNFWMEGHILRDMENGKIPDSYLKERKRRVETHMWKKNFAAIGNGTGGLAKVASDASGSTVTVLLDNSARGTSKGVYRLQVSTSDDPLYYDSVDPSTNTVVATFYISAKLSTTTFTASGFTVGAITDIDTGDWICESGSWNREMFGLGYHQSDSASRIYQGADVAADEFLRNASVDGGGLPVTPTMIHAAKQIVRTQANLDAGDEYPYVGHITPNNYDTLATYGYSLRTYNAEGGKANKTYGLPNMYEDGDTMWSVDADYEDCYIDLREKAPFFEYVQKPFGLNTVGGQGRHEWVGTNEAGSTNMYENYNEACNILWDAAGVDGSKSEGGVPNTGVFIKNLKLNAVNQATYGV